MIPANHLSQLTFAKLTSFLNCRLLLNCLLLYTARPCQPLVAPDNGAVACNGWNGRFGEVCTVLCQQDWDLPPGKHLSRLYVCGASGQWIPEMSISACSGSEPLVYIRSNMFCMSNSRCFFKYLRIV